MKTRSERAFIWGAQAGSLQFAAACREHDTDFTLTFALIHPASCRVVQAGSLRSPELDFAAAL
jgi:hypothetical protein